MIGFNALGHLGRLGNQMFQFAALKGIARNRGYEYCIPPSQMEGEWKDHHQYYNAVGTGAAQHQLLQPFKLSRYTNQLNFTVYRCRRDLWFRRGVLLSMKTLFNNCPDWVDYTRILSDREIF